MLDKAIDWKEDGDYYDVVSGFKGRICNFRYGDFVMRSDGLYIMGKHSLKFTDLEYPDKHLEIWKSNLETGFFMYTGYWDVECVWFNQRKYRTELINNLRILISGNVKIPTTHITINGKEFYIYVCNCGNDGDDLLFGSEYKNSEMLEIKEQLIEFFEEMTRLFICSNGLVLMLMSDKNIRMISLELFHEIGNMNQRIMFYGFLNLKFEIYNVVTLSRQA